MLIGELLKLRNKLENYKIIYLWKYIFNYFEFKNPNTNMIEIHRL